MQIRVMRLVPDAVLPRQGLPDDAGWDLTVSKDVVIMPGYAVNVESGLAVCVPNGYYIRLVPRSSCNAKFGLVAIEGIIDAGYTGPLYARVFNPGPLPVHVMKGDRLVQMLVCERPYVQWVLVDEMPVTPRGTKGFGSTGGTRDHLDGQLQPRQQLLETADGRSFLKRGAVMPTVGSSNKNTYVNDADPDPFDSVMGPEDFRGSDDESHLMSTKQGLEGHQPAKKADHDCG